MRSSLVGLIGLGLCGALAGCTSSGGGLSVGLNGNVATGAAGSPAVSDVRQRAAPEAIGRIGVRRMTVPTCSGSGTDSFVGGTDGNVAHGSESGVLTGISNEACDETSAIGAGANNAVSSLGDEAFDSFIGGGSGNAITVSAHDAFVGSGIANSITFPDGSIGGGTSNQIAGQAAGIGAGDTNTVSNTWGFIGAGHANTVSSESGVIAGGENNKTSGEFAVIGGGLQNTASGTESTVAGGGANVASGYASFAAGYHADADQGGSFVWSDSSSSVSTKATVANQFVARASGGVKFFSNSAMTTGVSLAAGGGSWASLSDRAVKTDIVPIDDARILDRVSAMPISEWSYISERGVRHVGPMAQDFRAAFGIGEDNTHITSIDEDGVALAAIKALHHENRGLLAQVAAMKVRQASLERRVSALAAALAATAHQ